jgi:TRAP-type C4-dicarboxylate transport system substrate-binding protein
MLILKKGLQVLFILGAAALLSFTSVTLGNAQEKTIVLKAVTGSPLSYYWMDAFPEFQKKVNTRLKGRLQINYLGGDEVVPAFEQMEAVRNGFLDVALSASSWYAGTIPEAHCLLFAMKDPPTMRKAGFYDLMDEIHLKKGNAIVLAYIGGTAGKGFRFYTNKKITKPDFTGMKMRVSPVYVEIVKALGGTPITMPPSDLYTALERGVVDGYGWTYGGLTAYGWQEVTKYVVDHPFYAANITLVINADVFKKLAPDIQKTLIEIGRELEAWADPHMAKYLKTEDAMYKGFGIEFIKFAPAEGKKLEETAYETGWKQYLAKNPVYGPKFKALADRAQ